ncbi:hypothetical protein [Pseudomonas putida]|uniref:Uncharacterized protein n=1 Tax=Pseudomonas putida TaxID=303 RepID=A0A8I1EGC5_PSEPU|nr:hypothetical protein [Pseudomonas putida]MBI6885136.1 hypothetical protein [Pseudomonas putida]
MPKKAAVVIFSTLLVIAIVAFGIFVKEDFNEKKEAHNRTVESCVFSEKDKQEWIKLGSPGGYEAWRNWMLIDNFCRNYRQRW